MSGGDPWVGTVIDVSKWQTSLPSLTGVIGVIARAGIGTKPDLMFDDHIANARKAGKWVGSYWYNIGSLTPSEEVDAYIAREVAVGGVDLHTLDWEGTDGFTAAQAAEFIRIYKARTGDPILLYASEGRFRDLGQDANWIANYSHEPTKQYDMWQYGPFRGVDGNNARQRILDLVGQKEVASSMDINIIKAEDWVPSTSSTGASNGVFRSAPVRSNPVIGRIALGVIVRTIAEVTGPAGDNWRLTEFNGAPAYMLRTDLVPLDAGGDPSVDQLLTDLIARKAPVVTDDGFTKATQDAAVLAQKAADQAAIDAANAAAAQATADLASAPEKERERIATASGAAEANRIRTI